MGPRVKGEGDVNGKKENRRVFTGTRRESAETAGILFEGGGVTGRGRGEGGGGVWGGGGWGGGGGEGEGGRRRRSVMRTKMV